MKSFLFLLLLVYCSLANAGTYVKKKSDACGAYILKPGNYCNLASSNAGDPGEKYDYRLTIDQCITKCKEDAKCTFFIFGTGSKAGRCWRQYTASADCSEGWVVASTYDFWKVIPGEENIITTKECGEAAVALSLSATTANTEVDTTGNYPKGCYHNDPSGNDRLWINAATSGTSVCETDSQCVCKTVECKDSFDGDILPKTCILKSPSNCHGSWKLWTKMSGSANPFDGVDVFKSASPAPIIRDGKTDMYVGDSNSYIRYYKNTGTNSNPVYTRQTGTDNPMDNAGRVGGNDFNADPYLFDVDNDGK